MNDQPPASPSATSPGVESAAASANPGVAIGVSNPGSSPVPWRGLDARVVPYWRIRSLIASMVLLALALGAGLYLYWAFPDAWLGFGAAWLALLLFRVVWLIWYPPVAFRAWQFRVDERVLEIQEGVWWRSLMLLPLSRLQHVDLHQGPIERHYGLATLIFHTAGTHEASIPLPGLEAGEAARLRDQLVAIGGDDAV